MVVITETKDMFWALVLETGKKYSKKVEHGFHISMAALELPSDSDAQKGKAGNVAVMGGTEKDEFLLCNLNSRSMPQQALDLNFSEGNITFYINGQGTVHLTGYRVEDDDDLEGLEGFGDMSDEESEEEVPELVSSNKKRKQQNDPQGSAKKTKWITAGDDDDDDDDDDDSEDSDFDDGDDDMDDSQFLDMEAEDDDEDDDDDDEFDDDDDEEEEVISPKKKTPKADKTNKPQTPKQGEKTPKQGEKTPGKKDKTPGKDAQSAKKQEQQKPETPATTPGPGGDAQSEKKKKKKKKKNKNKEGGEANGQPSTPQVTESKTPQGKGQQQKKQVLGGGTISEDIKVGDGPQAKPGQMAHMYYVGKLQKDGRQFDSCTGGKPFRFRLGKGEVIKGWDAGVAGMKVGGKRRLTVPPQAGYGNQRSGPIPPNSTLVFEVELKKLS